jgi:hypothetical protein
MQHTQMDTPRSKGGTPGRWNGWTARCNVLCPDRALRRHNLAGCGRRRLATVQWAPSNYPFCSLQSIFQQANVRRLATAYHYGNSVRITCSLQSSLWPGRHALLSSDLPPPFVNSMGISCLPQQQLSVQSAHRWQAERHPWPRSRKRPGVCRPGDAQQSAGRQRHSIEILVPAADTH